MPSANYNDPSELPGFARCLSVSNVISNVGLSMPTLVGSVPLRKQEKDGSLSHQPFMNRWLYGAVASTGAIISP